MKKILHSELLCVKWMAFYRRVQKFLFSSKAVLDCTFLIYHANPEKQSRFNKFSSFTHKVSNWHFKMALKAQKRLSVPSFAEIGTRVALRLSCATWCVVKGIVRNYAACFTRR